MSRIKAEQRGRQVCADLGCHRSNGSLAFSLGEGLQAVMLGEPRCFASPMGKAKSLAGGAPEASHSTRTTVRPRPSMPLVKSGEMP
jgi:hypothetical protein